MRRLFALVLLLASAALSSCGESGSLVIRFKNPTAAGSSQLNPLIISSAPDTRGVVLMEAASSDFDGDFAFGPEVLVDGTDIIGEDGEVIYDGDDGTAPDGEPPPFAIVPGLVRDVYVIIDPIDCLDSGGVTVLRILVGPDGGSVSDFEDVYVQTTDPGSCT